MTINKFLKIFAIGWIIFLAIVIFQANSGDRSAFYFRLVYAIPYGDKIGHFCLMGILSFLLNGAIQARRISIGRFSLLLGSILVFIGVFLEELSQLFLPERTFSPADLSADILGIFVGGRLAAYLLQQYQNRSQHNKIGDSHE